MKNLFALLLFLPFLLLGQEEFSFPIYFEDAIGHRDTVVFGYDGAATDSLDLAFGEADISDIPWDTTLDVRFAANWQGQSHTQGGQYVSPFQTKKQVVSPLCDGDASVIPVEIFTRHWPVTASWDSTLFQGACLSTTTFSSIISDALGGSRRVFDEEEAGLLGFVNFGEESRITFTEQRGGEYIYIYEVVLDSTRVDTVNLFWVTLNEAAFDGYVLSVDPSDQQPARFRFSPSGSLAFTLPAPGHVTLTAFTPSGRQVAVLLSRDFSAGSHTHRVDASSFPNGLYVFRLEAGGRTESRKVLLSR